MNFNFSILNLLLLFLFFIFYFIEDRYHKIKNKNLIFFLIFTPLIIYIFGDNLYAKWWIVDDHEIFFYLTQSGNVQQPSFFTWFKETLLNKTEIGQFGEYPRFRLSYFLFRILEAYLFKDTSWLYYSIRIILILYFFYTLYLVFTRFFKITLSLAICFLVFFESYWSDIFSRLGPGEWYCILGTSIILHVIFYSRNFLKFNIIENLILSFAIVLASGSKENFFILIFLSFYLVYRNWINHGKKTTVIISLLPIIFILFSILPLLLYFLRRPTDMYGNSTKFYDRIIHFIPFFQSEFFILTSIIGICIVVVSILTLFKKNINLKLFDFKNIILLISTLIFIFFFNVIFYNSNWPTNMRYDFPGILSFQIVIILALYLAILIIFKNMDLTFKSKILFKNILLCAIICFLINFKSGEQLKNYSFENRQRTNLFSNFLNQFIKEYNANRYELIFYINRGLDLEPLLSFHRFLNYYGINGKNSIIVSNKIEGIKHQAELMNAMRSFSINGNQEYSIEPLNRIKLKSANCYVLIFKPSKIEDFQEKNLCRNVRVMVIPF